MKDVEVKINKCYHPKRENKEGTMANLNKQMDGYAYEKYERKVLQGTWRVGLLYNTTQMSSGYGYLRQCLH